MVDVNEYRNVHIPVDSLKIVHHLFGGHRVQRGHRLIRQDNLRILGQGASQGYPLLLAAGKLIRPDKGFVQNSHLIQGFQRLHLFLLREDAKSCPPPGQIRDKGGEHILDNSGAGNQVEGLENHADTATKFPQVFSMQGHHIGAVHRQLALGNVVHPIDGTNQGGLARA